MESDIPVTVEPATENVSVETTTDIPMVDSTSSSVDLSSIIPSEYAEKGWVKDIKTVDDLFKMTDGLKSEIGKRPAGIPHESASPEEKAAFNKAFGVPETAELYQLADPVEGMEKFQDGLKKVLHEAGISQSQAALLDKGYAGLLETMKAEMGVDSEAQNAAFEKLAVETFGERRDEVMQTSKSLISENIPEAMKPHLDSLSNEHLMLLAAFADNIQQKYIAEDSMVRPSGQTNEANSVAELSSKARELMATPEYQSTMHPGHGAVKAQVDQIYDLMRKKSLQ